MTYDPKTAKISSLLFGQNLEHTRNCIYQGLSAQLIRNRKFAGKPSHDGIAMEWNPCNNGEKFFPEMSRNPQSGDGRLICEMIWSFRYTRHETSLYGKMPRRNECFTQAISCCGTVPVGIVQKKIPLCKGEKYLFRIALCNGARQKAECAVVSICSGGRILHMERFSGLMAQWSVRTFSFFSPDECEAELFIGLEKPGVIWCGMVSLLPEENFHGMRPDVIEHLKSIGTSVIRWPGGNFAGEYFWRDGLLDADSRAPSQSVMEIETQPYTNGFDYNELGTDDIIALCHEIGAEPFFTINPVWFSPEESAAWIEYCNGTADTPMGKLRTERGFPEPYRVRYWSLGNEMGFPHMEGEKKPEQYAVMGKKHADALLEKDDSITICSSGPYPSPDWCRLAAVPLKNVAQMVSLHHYAIPESMNFSTPEACSKTYRDIVSRVDEFESLVAEMRRDLPPELDISLDEWNIWYTWYRNPGPAEGMFTARFFHWLFGAYRRYGIGCACYFEAVNEGAILVDARNSRLTAAGQVFSIMAGHADGIPCPEWNSRPGCFATCHTDGIGYLTCLNDSWEDKLSLDLPELETIDSAVIFSAPDIYPGSHFVEEVLKPESKTILLPPRSILVVKWKFDL